MKNLIIKSFPEFVNKPKQELYDYLKKENYHLAGKKELEECLKNPPEEMKNANWYYFFGDLLRDEDGHWSAPRVFWRGDELYWNGNWLVIDWPAYARVVLLKEEFGEKGENKDKIKQQIIELLEKL